MFHMFKKLNTFAFYMYKSHANKRKNKLKLTKTNYRKDSFVDYPEKSKLLRNPLSTHIFLSNVLCWPKCLFGFFCNILWKNPSKLFFCQPNTTNQLCIICPRNKISLMFLLIMMVIFLIDKVKH